MIDVLSLNLTSKCNLNCSYCYEKDKSDVLADFDMVTALVDETKLLGVREVCLMGGEPLFYDRIVELIKYLHKKGMRANLFTNGTLITKDLASKLKMYNVRVFVSLKEETQNMIRESLDRLTAAGFSSENLFVVVVGVRQNRLLFPILAELSRARGVAPVVLRAIPMGSCPAADVMSEQECQVLMSDSGLPPSAFKRLCEVTSENGSYRRGIALQLNGDITVCPAITSPAGNIFNLDLNSIVRKLKKEPACRSEIK